LYRPCSNVQCKAAGYPLHSHLSPSLPLPCVTVCHQVPNALYAHQTMALSSGEKDKLTSDFQTRQWWCYRYEWAKEWMRTESFVLRCQAIIMMTDDTVVGMGKSEDVEENLYRCSSQALIPQGLCWYSSLDLRHSLRNSLVAFTYLLNCLRTYSLHGEESFLRSLPVLSWSKNSPHIYIYLCVYMYIYSLL